MNLFFFIINTAITNSYTLSKSLNLFDRIKTKRQFLEELSLLLCKDYIIKRDFTLLDQTHKNDRTQFVDRYNLIFGTNLVQLNRSNNALNNSKDYCIICLETKLKSQFSKTSFQCNNCYSKVCQKHFEITCSNCVAKSQE